MKANTNKKNKSASRKLVPAVAMLTTSAVMLSSATYAWFTLNREVEVTGLQMTATTPEDIQISLGAIGTPSEVNSLTNNGGFLTGDAPAADTDWSNIADISTYYAFGKLIPASSTNGENIFYTPDAAGVGRTLKSTAQFHQAVADDAATAHRYINADEKAEGKSWLTTSYSPSTSWNVTNDDGYYVDIPVWLRTSSANNQTIYVYGYACDKTEETTEEADTDDLYKAVRVAILDKDGKANKGCLVLKDGGDTYVNKDTDADRLAQYPTSTTYTNILDSDNYNSRASASGINAVSGLGTNNAGAWGAITQNNGSTGNDVAVLPGGSGATFGTAQKLIIRVWIEGEDGNCWNRNANQDWSISLRFTKEPLA